MNATNQLYELQDLLNRDFPDLNYKPSLDYYEKFINLINIRSKNINKNTSFDIIKNSYPLVIGLLKNIFESKYRNGKTRQLIDELLRESKDDTKKIITQHYYPLCDYYEQEIAKIHRNIAYLNSPKSKNILKIKITRFFEEYTLMFYDIIWSLFKYCPKNTTDAYDNIYELWKHIPNTIQFIFFCGFNL